MRSLSLVVLMMAALASGCAETHDDGHDVGPALDGSASRFGAPRATDAECAGLTCLTTLESGDPICPSSLTFPGGYCGIAASTDTSEGCPSGLLTIELGRCTMDGAPNVFACLAPCTTDADCRVSEGYHCEAAFTGTGGCSFD